MSRARTSEGTGSGQNGCRLLCRRGIAANRSRSAYVGGRGVAGVRRATTSGPASCGRSTTRAGVPAAASAIRALKVAAPQAIRTAQPPLSATTSWRNGSASTSIPPSRSRKRHGWLLCRDGARTAASAARRRSVSS